MTVLAILIIGLISVLITYLSLFLYRHYYDKTRLMGSNVSSQRLILSPPKVLIISLVVFAIIIASFWKVVFPDYVKININQDYSTTTITEIESEISKYYQIDDQDLYFAFGDFINFYLDNNYQFKNNLFNSISFEKDGQHHQLQYIINGEEQEAWIPTHPVVHNWSLNDETFLKLEYQTIVDLLNAIKIPTSFASLGTLEANEYYNLQIDMELIRDYSIIEYYLDQGDQLYIIDLNGNKTIMDETSYQDDSLYLSVSLLIMSPIEEDFYEPTASHIYYFDVSDYLVNP